MKNTSASPFDETPAPFQDETSPDQGSKSSPSLHPKADSSAFHETSQPLGVHFGAFMEDFVFDCIPEKRLEALDKNSARVRGLILQAEKGGVSFELSGVEVHLQYRIAGEGEEWTVSI